MEFSREIFIAFSDALSCLYDEPAQGERIASLTCVLRQVFPDCIITTSTFAIPHSRKRGLPTRISLPVNGTPLNLVISKGHGLGLHEQFLADRLRIHLEAAFSPARKQRTKASEPPDASRARVLGLTPRECEVLKWLMVGKRDAEIASEIGVAGRTVNKHVENILRKLGVETRGGAAHAAAERLPRIPPTT